MPSAPHTSPRRTRPGILFGVCIVFVCIAVLVIVWPKHHPTVPTNTARSTNTEQLVNAAGAAANIDDAVPVDTLPDVHGTPLSIAQKSDSTLVVVAAWHHACTDCRSEVIALNSLVGKYANRASFYAIASGETASAVAADVAASGITSTVLVAGDGAPEVLRGDDAIPTLYFVSKRTVVGVGIGVLNVTQIETKLTQLLASS